MPNKVIPYSRQYISRKDIKAVLKTLKSDFLTQGPAVSVFENSLSQFSGAKYAIAASSATGALHIACLALDVQAGDRVWTSPNSFVASANCARYCGATIDFVDIDPFTANMSAVKLAEKLETAKKSGKLPKVVIPVHFAGQSCEMDKINDLSQVYGFKIIEDASHAIGGKFRGEVIGNCRYSDITVFSFHPVKIITTGEGGAALTNSVDIARKMRLLVNHGITREKELFNEVGLDEIWNYQQINLGFNYRMTDIQAALGTSQLSKINQFTKVRNKIIKNYNDAFEHFPLKALYVAPYNDSANHLHVIRVESRLQKSLYLHLKNSGIEANLHYIPIHLHPYFVKLGFKLGDFPESEKHFRTAISIPVYVGLKRHKQKQVINSINEFFQKIENS